MKKFVVLTCGFVPPTDNGQRARGEWFKSVGPRLVDPDSPFGRGVDQSRPGGVPRQPEAEAGNAKRVEQY